jgi:dUTP pyrophosphatase
MQVKIKRLSKNGVIPQYAKAQDAGLDLVATSREYTTSFQITYGTGIAIEIPEGYVGLVFPRSSIKNQNLVLSNSVGILDAGYRGEIKLTFLVTDQYLPNRYSVGDRIGQLIIMPYPQIEFLEVDELSDSERGTGGFGSSGS